MRVLVTGAAGKLGCVLIRGLRDSYKLRGLDLAAVPELPECIVGDVSDFETVLRASKNMDAIIHLGSVNSTTATWPSVLKNNVIGTYNVFEAARKNKVPRVVFSSRINLLGPHLFDEMLTPDLLPKPDSYYAVSKVAGENLGYMYSSRFNLEVVCIRMGNIEIRPSKHYTFNQLKPKEALRIFKQALTRQGIKFEIIFGISNDAARQPDFTPPVEDQELKALYNTGDI